MRCNVGNFYEDNDDLRFYVERAIDWEPIVRLTEHDFRSPDGPKSTAEALETYQDVLALVGGFVADEIGANWRALDAAHPKLVDGEVKYPPVMEELFEKLASLELNGLNIPRELGGLNAPVVLMQVTNELFARADVSICAHHGFHGGMAMAALVYSVLEGSTTFDRELPGISSTRFQHVIDDILAGGSWGSMDITEPHAGSDMANLRTRGVLGEDGVWRVTGSKTFITSGHGRWHFVIARTEDKQGDDAFAGLNGLSMFLVPAFDENGVRTHTTIDAVESKMGHHGSATVGISFEDAPAELIGKRGEGFKYMLMLMNNARIGVGFEALGLCEAAYRMAKAYAAERPSMGKTIDKHEMIADMLDEMRTDIQGIRCLGMAAVQLEEIAQKIDIQLRFDPPADPAERERLEKRMKRAKRRARELTPVLKYLASEKAVEIARRNVQIHGGAGYMVEYGAEKLLRDAMVMPIYEGTSQIQGLMAMKDTLMAAVKHPRTFVRESARARWTSVSSRDPLERRVAKLEVARNQSVQHLLSRLAGHKLSELRHEPMGSWGSKLSHFDPKRDFALAMLHAERLIRILADVQVAQELYAQAKRFPERTEVLERWLERAEPRTAFLLTEITTTGHRLLRSLGHETEDVDQAAK
ncbi:MAG: acyl-CoA dehydrogenase family protein [Alphaproteobacteria bacterium]|nr:acyl-CoA dehydrogenase family protein [Alphaproteobacteria bacterium]MCB9698481.1 acyl-CoA dehydrogenase family protein [Alphaproteobacteria bacterium]